MTAHRVRLGGPKNMSLGGRKRKAPVVGRVSKPKAKTETSKRRSKPKAKKNEVGLNRKKKPPRNKKKNPDPPKTASDKVTRKSKSTPTPTPVPEKDTKKSAKAIGGLGGETGVSLDIGDGAEDVNLEDLEFITYYKMLRARLTERWARHGLRGGKCTVRFEISKTGSVSNVSITKSSGLGYLDGPAKRAVMGVELPPLPESYKGETVTLNIVFNYDKK